MDTIVLLESLTPQRNIINYGIFTGWNGKIDESSVSIYMVMIQRTRASCFLLFLILGVILSSGCTSVRTSDTHNTTIAVQSYNAWAEKQRAADQTIHRTAALIGSHVTTYNAEIAKDQPDLPLLRENLALDQQGLDQWGSEVSSLSAASDQFEKETTALTYDNASAVKIRQTLSLLTQYMRISVVDRENARQHLIEYVNKANAYLSPDDPEYWNDRLRLDAMDAKEQALGSLTDGNAALDNVTKLAAQLEQLQ